MSSRYKIPDDIVEEMINLHNSSDLSYNAIARKYGYSRSFVYNIIKNNEKKGD